MEQRHGIAAAYEAQGFVCIPDVFDEAALRAIDDCLAVRVARLRSQLLPASAPVNDPAVSPAVSLAELHAAVPLAELSHGEFDIFRATRPGTGDLAATHRLVTSPRLLEAVAALLGDKNVTYSYSGICRPKLPATGRGHPPSRATAPTPLHQDSQYFDSVDGSFSDGEVRAGLEHSTSLEHIVSVWAPLVDTTPDGSGCLELIPGSHTRGLFAGKRDSLSNMVSVENVEAVFGPRIPVSCPRGGVILFSNLCFHGSGANRSEQVRWSLDWRYHAAVAEPSRSIQWWETNSAPANRPEGEFGPICVLAGQGTGTSGGVPEWADWQRMEREAIARATCTRDQQARL